MKRSIPILIASLSGMVLVLAFFSPRTESWSEAVVDWFNVLAAIAFILGAGSLLKVQLVKISSRSPGWAYAAITLAAFLFTLLVGLFKVGTVPSDKFPTHVWTGDYEAPQATFGWIYLYVMSPLTATMFAMLAFYVASAAFRAFRAKNLAAILLLSAAFLVLLGRTAAAGFLTGWFPEPLEALKLDNLVDTMLVYVGTPGSRAIVIGIALGVAATSLRVLLGLERPYLGGGGGNG